MRPENHHIIPYARLCVSIKEFREGCFTARSRPSCVQVKRWIDDGVLESICIGDVSYLRLGSIERRFGPIKSEKKPEKPSITGNRTVDQIIYG